MAEGGSQTTRTRSANRSSLRARLYAGALPGGGIPRLVGVLGAAAMRWRTLAVQSALDDRRPPPHFSGWIGVAATGVS
ncbi:hypothetical protein HK28_01310 [Acetobacter sp. DsW_063]|nr:hypothetical protein HK28_01310 [Acetobacter sp. DsW_063]